MFRCQNMEWLYSGVNKTVPRNAGPECAAFMHPKWRRVETAIVLTLAVIALKWSYRKIHLPSPTYYTKLAGRKTSHAPNNHPPQPNQIGGGKNRGGGGEEPFVRTVLLVLMCVIWGMEIGYKFSSRTVIYLLNPCHVTTAIQIYLLAAAPTHKTVTAVFRFHLNLLNGPLLAFLFPETETRILPLESSVYWLQHGIMFVVPYYLFRFGGAYNIEEISDLSWSIFSYAINVIYHFGFLQIIAIPTEVNLNHMLCPALADPFEGQFYRVFALLHQAVLCAVLSKLFFKLTKLLTFSQKYEIHHQLPNLNSKNPPEIDPNRKHDIEPQNRNLNGNRMAYENQEHLE